jgi:hypothetical protein
MAKPLPTADTLKTGKIAHLLRASLQETDGRTQHDEPEREERLEPETWTDSQGIEDSQPIEPFPREETKAEKIEPQKLTNSMQLDAVRVENSRLRHTVHELEATIEELERSQSGSPAARLRELEAVLEEKDSVIRELHDKLHGGEAPARTESKASAPTQREHEEDLLALSEELERDRRQLKEDEEALMQQMRQMEIQLSRERAEVARQRSELTRLHNEIRHEMELAARDAGLRERLAPLQRRHQDLLARRSGAPSSRHEHQPQAAPEQATEDTPPSSTSSIFRRLFGGK